MQKIACVLFVGLVLVACSSDTQALPVAIGATTASSTTPKATEITDSATTVPETSPATDPPATSTTIDATSTVAANDTSAEPTKDRPYDVFVPTTYDGSNPTPLVILLHGYTARGSLQEAYFQWQPLAEERGFLYVHPDGLKDPIGNGFWNATDACCNFLANPVDDVAYISAIIDQVQAKYNVDPKRIYLAGHSNGGFMSYRMACEKAGKIAAIASLAGETFADPATCKPSEPVSVLQIQGTADGTINYEGGEIRGVKYPGAETTTATWAKYNGCQTTPAPEATKVDLDVGIAGDESSISTYSGCAPGTSVELWTIDGGAHIPALSPTFGSKVIDFLFAHPKP
jgi:polyhydroxybutyrate depolymerase